MESNFYEKQFTIGPNGEKLSLLMLESCYFLCETVGNNKDEYFKSLDIESQEIYSNRCDHKSDKTYKKLSNEMIKWLDEKIAANEKDSDIIWKASSMHHPMFGMFY